jgi:hypothetical protein
MNNNGSHNFGTGTFRPRTPTQTWAPNAELFAQKAGLNPFPSAYANRGATTADLDSRALESIRLDIAENISADAAFNYVRMIEDVPYLSAEVFLTMLYTLETAAWRWDSSCLLTHSEFSSKARDSRGFRDGIALRDETQYIKSQFMSLLRSRDEGVKLEKYSW